MLRPVIAATVLGGIVGSLLAASVPFARAEGTPGTVTIDNFSFGPQTLTVKAGTTVTWTNRDDIAIACSTPNDHEAGIIRGANLSKAYSDVIIHANF